MAANFPNAAVDVPTFVPGQTLAGPPSHSSMHTSLEEEVEAMAAGVTKGTRGGDEKRRAVSAGTSHTVDLTFGNGHRVTMTGNTAFTFPTVTGVSVGRLVSFQLILVQDATGGRLPTFPASVRWMSATAGAAGSAPTFDTAPNRETRLAFDTYDDGATWTGYFQGYRAAT